IPGAAAPVAGALPRTAPPADRPLRIGFIGVHDPVKGLDTLAATAHRLAGEPIEFLIAGTGHGDYAKALPGRFPDGNTRFL
uniref:hypothetical protein n=1 Tax=Streptomyces niveiscabiei TaxID=164115 RepID=UPI0038F7DEA6